MEDQAGTVALSQLSKQMGICPHSSWEKAGSLSGSSPIAEHPAPRLGLKALLCPLWLLSLLPLLLPPKGSSLHAAERLATIQHCNWPQLLPGVVGLILACPPDILGHYHISGSASFLLPLLVQGFWVNAGSLSGPQPCPRAASQISPRNKPCGAV